MFYQIQMTYQIVSLKINEENHAYFWRGHRFPSNNLTLSRIQDIKEGTTSHFYTAIDDKILFKLFKTKTHNSPVKIFTENVAKYFMGTSAVKELNGNKLLANIGLSVPKTYGIGFPFDIINPYKCLYVQEHLPNTTSLKAYVKEATVAKQKIVLSMVFKDIWCMRRHNLFFRDMRPVDVLIDKDESIHWVDTRVNKIVSNKSFNKRFEKQFNKFLNDLINFGVNEQNISHCIPKT